jgi:hypothetical protein
LTDDVSPPDDVPSDESPDERDRALLIALARALGTVDDTDLIARSTGLLAWIDVDAELAALLERPPAELAGTRGDAAAADLEFTVDDGTCVIEISVRDGTVRGVVLGVTPEHVAVRSVTGELHEAEFDAVGAFTVNAAVAGSARVELDLGEERRIHTDWFVI